jgi:hypothetical protein
MADGGSRLARQLVGIDGCARPVRLTGHVDHVDTATGEIRRAFSTTGEPGGVLRVRCNNRRGTVCPSCSKLYKGDARLIVRDGLTSDADGEDGQDSAGGVGPAVFVTLTAPSFGPVHSRRERDGVGRVCRPRTGACVHGRSVGCAERHGGDDPRLGEPVCPDCYRYTDLVVWNSLCPLLWKRTMEALRRGLARRAGSLAALRRTVRVDFVKVAEMQHRGAVHLHAVIRLGPAEAGGELPEWAGPALLVEAITMAARTTSVPLPALLGGAAGQLTVDEAAGPTPDPAVRWGVQLDVRPIAVGGTVTAGMVAAYLAKYVTKGSDSGAALDAPVRDIGHLDVVRLRPHLTRLIHTAWRLGTDPTVGPMLDEIAGRSGKRAGLLRWAHQAGYGGHALSKSRGYSTTFGALRGRRRTHRQAEAFPDGIPVDAFGRPESDDGGATVRIGYWRYAGRGFHGDAERLIGEVLAGLPADEWPER